MNLALHLTPANPLLVAAAVGICFAAGAGLGWLINWASGRRT